MKTATLLTAILLSLMVGCDLIDDGGSGGGGGSSVRDTSSVIDNSSGVYDGSWRVIYESIEDMEKFVVDYHPEHSDIDSTLEINVYTDTSEIIVLKGDSVAVFSYDSANIDTYEIEYFLLSSLDEYDTTGIFDELKEELTEVNEDGVFEYTENALESYNLMALSGDTLTLEMGMNIDVGYSTEITDTMLAEYYGIDPGTVTGKYQVYFLLQAKMVKYTGTIPPESWPKDFVIDTSDEEDEIPDDSITQIVQDSDDSLFNLLIGSWNGEYDDGDKLKSITVVISENEYLFIQDIIAYYFEGDTLTGDALSEYLTEKGKEYPQTMKGICKVRDGMLSILWEDSTEPQDFAFYFDMSETVLTIFIQDAALVLTKKEDIDTIIVETE